jgi:sarcosine oxidase subunit alpha
MTGAPSAAGQPFRLASGGRIDRSRPVSFAFDGRA